MKWLAALPFVGLTVLCWGMYGPVLHRGQTAMDNSRMRALLCVGAAYFVIGVIVPVVVLSTNGEAGGWSFRGIFWSSAAGTAGAVGALGIILAFRMGGSPIWVMPLVFGGAPVVNAFLAMAISGAHFRDQPTGRLMFFSAGLVMVAIGAFLVLFFAPKADHAASSHARAPQQQSTASEPAQAPLEGSSS